MAEAEALSLQADLQLARLEREDAIKESNAIIGAVHAALSGMERAPGGHSPSPAESTPPPRRPPATPSDSLRRRSHGDAHGGGALANPNPNPNPKPNPNPNPSPNPNPNPAPR